MIALKKNPHTSLTPELIAAMSRDILAKTLSLDSDPFVKLQRAAITAGLTELNEAFHRVQTSAFTATREQLDGQRDAIVIAIRLHIRAAIAQYMIDKTKADQAKVVNSIVKKLDSNVTNMSYDAESTQIHALLAASEKISGAVDESGSTLLFSALRTVQGKFDKVGIDKDASGEFTHNARPIRVIRGDITEAIDTLMSFLRSSAKHVPVKFDSVVIALNEMIDRFAANQQATETREETAKKVTELAAE